MGHIDHADHYDRTDQPVNRQTASRVFSSVINGLSLSPKRAWAFPRAAVLAESAGFEVGGFAGVAGGDALGHTVQPFAQFGAEGGLRAALLQPRVVALARLRTRPGSVSGGPHPAPASGPPANAPCARGTETP